MIPFWITDHMPELVQMLVVGAGVVATLVQMMVGAGCQR